MVKVSSIIVDMEEEEVNFPEGPFCLDTLSWQLGMDQTWGDIDYKGYMNGTSGVIVSFKDGAKVISRIFLDDDFGQIPMQQSFDFFHINRELVEGKWKTVANFRRIYYPKRYCD